MYTTNTYKWLFVTFLLLHITSCKDSRSKEKEIAQIVSEWQGKEILFPEGITFTRYVNDTVDWAIPEESRYKVLVYVDPLGCISCTLQLRQWKSFIAQVDSLTGGEGIVPFLFFFHHDDYKETLYLMKTDQFDLPVCIDREDRLNQLNKFPSDITFQTFLLDEDNQVAVIGNPIHNLAVRDLYLKQIAGESGGTPSGKKTVTTVTVAESAINMGTFPKTEKRTAVFTLRNSGNNPLAIAGMATTCGCASAQYDKHPAMPGGELKVEIEMAPKEAGFFSEVITVKCNTNETIKLTIRGHAQ